MSIQRYLPVSGITQRPDARPADDEAALRAQAVAFEAYVAAQALAKETLRFEDARQAGRAWARFIDLYLPADRRIGDV